MTSRTLVAELGGSVREKIEEIIRENEKKKRAVLAIFSFTGREGE